MALKNQSELVRGGVVCCVLVVSLGGLMAAWDGGANHPSIDPAIEKACFDEVEQRAPLGHRAIFTYGYQEEGSGLGVANGGLEAQYAPNAWTTVYWTCRINLGNQRVERVEVSQSNTSQKMRAAAAKFQK